MVATACNQCGAKLACTIAIKHLQVSPAVELPMKNVAPVADPNKLLTLS